MVSPRELLTTKKPHDFKKFEVRQIFEMKGATPSYDGAIPAKASDVKYHYIFAGWTPTVVNVTGDATYTATYTPELRQYTVTFVDNEKNYGSVVSSNGTTNITVDYETPISINGRVITISGVTFTATPKVDADGYSYEFKNWENTATQVTGDRTIKANFIRYATIGIETEGLNGNTYGVNVYDSSNSLINETPYTESFKLETEKVYTIKVVSSLMVNEVNNKYQILRVYENGTNLFTQDSLKGHVDKTVYNKATLSEPRTYKFEYLGAYFLTVDGAKDTISGLTIKEVNEGKNVVIHYSSRNGYIISDETELSFEVNSTPTGAIDNMSTFIGFEYILNGETYTVGVNGGSDILYNPFTHNNQYVDSEIGTYVYKISSDNLTSIKVLTIKSKQIVINPVGVTGKLTLTSEYGFNKVVDSSTSKLILHNGVWTISTTDWTFAQIQNVFGAENVSKATSATGSEVILLTVS